MKVQAVLLPLVFSLVSAESYYFSHPKQASLNAADVKVPGENPLHFCSENLAEDLLRIDTVDLSPNPPEAGKTLSIAAQGYLKENVEEGAKVHIQVKYGVITLINQEADLCDQVKNVDLECPLKKGDLALTKDVDLPKEIPPGRYTVLAKVYTKDKKPITCLNAQVAFSRR